MRRSKTSIVGVGASAAMVWLLLGCEAAAPDGGLDPDGPPKILQVFARERVAITDDEGHTYVELQARLAFGDHPDIDAEVDDRQVTSAVARDGQRLRIVVDELLRGNELEEIPCADGSWSRVPVGTDIDDIARCAGADLSKCEAVCIGADGPVGILDENRDGAIDDTRLIDGVVTLTCDGEAVPLDPQRSYYQPSGSQRLSGGSVGTDSLGPAIVIAPAAGMRPNARCGLAFAPTVVDKQGVALCAASAGGCTPGDTSAIELTVEPFGLASSEPADGATDVELTGKVGPDATIAIQLNAALDPDTVARAVKLVAGGESAVEVEARLDEHDDATVVITLPGGFRAATTYAVTVSGGPDGLKDVHADTLADDTTITFTTKAE